MRLKVLRIENGAEYEGNIFDFWIDFQTHKGHVIKVFDSTPFDLRGQENKEIDGILLAGFIQKKGDTGQEINGTIISEVTIPQIEWTKQKALFTQRQWYGFVTDYGTFLLDKSDVNSAGLVSNIKTTLRFGRIDILAVKLPK